LNKLRMALSRFMQGRYGADQLSLALLYVSLFVHLLSAFTARVGWLSSLFSTLGLVLLGLCIFRILSRNSYARGAENRKFLTWFYPIRQKASQAYERFKNRKVYSYFSCPQCKCKMRLPKSVHGTVKITCKSCGTAFEKKL